MITVIINGKEKTFNNDLTVAHCLMSINLSHNKHLAVALNGRILTRAELRTDILKNGDILEIVMPVGGG